MNGRAKCWLIVAGLAISTCELWICFLVVGDKASCIPEGCWGADPHSTLPDGLAVDQAHLLPNGHSVSFLPFSFLVSVLVRTDQLTLWGVKCLNEVRKT